jgi:DNA invertase Pin-like site-specific DNA recombinase
MKIKINLAPSMIEAEKIEEEIAGAMQKAKDNRASEIEIAYGTHSGERKKRILNFLNKKEYRDMYSRLVKTKEGWGRVFVYFRWDNKRR